MTDGLEVTYTDCGLATIWYPDGDICADIVYGNLALGIDAADMARLFVAAPKLLAALKAVEWYRECDSSGLPPLFFCPWCHRVREHGHAPDCLRQAAIAEASDE